MSWAEIQAEAKDIVEFEPFLLPVLNKYVLTPSSFSEAISIILAEAFAGIIPEADWLALFLEAHSVSNNCSNDNNSNGVDDTVNGKYENNNNKGSGARLKLNDGGANISVLGLQDLVAVRERDPACDRLTVPLINFKGYKAIQAYRISHIVWLSGKKETARVIQSRASQVFGVDIHPAAKIGGGLMIDHGTGVVVGETAAIGTNCSFLHGVTLGSTGKERGDRHPKLGNSVLVGCNATILGNIVIGDSCKIGSGSIVLKSLPCGATAVGNPARIVGRSLCPSAGQGMDHALLYVQTGDGSMFRNTWSITADGSSVFAEVDTEKRGRITVDQAVTAYSLRFHHEPPITFLQQEFAEVDDDQDGLITVEEFESMARRLASLDASGLMKGDREWKKLSFQEWQSTFTDVSLLSSNL